MASQSAKVTPGKVAEAGETIAFGGLANTNPRPASTLIVKAGTANGAIRGPNQSSNIGTSSPARR
jgi:hypothetical protein